MLKMVIADDEFIIRDGLAHSFPWGDYGIEIVGEAADGAQAYDLCRRLKPDLLLTDIRMPVMDGLEVAMRLKDEKSGIKVMIISGIQDFSYAKTAIDLNVGGYLLKPIKLKEMKETIRNFVEEINLERKRASDFLRLKDEAIENLSVIREALLKKLVFKTNLDRQQMLGKLAGLNLPINLSGSNYISLLKMDDYNNILTKLFKNDKLTLHYGTLNIINEILTQKQAGFAFAAYDNEFIILARNEGPAAALSLMEELSLRLNSYCRMTVSIGIGNCAEDIFQIFKSYNDAKTALEFKFFTGQNAIIHISDITNIYGYENKSKAVDAMDANELTGQLIACVKIGDEKNVLLALNEIFVNISADFTVNPSRIYSLFIELVCGISKCVLEFGDRIENIVAEMHEIMTELQGCQTLLSLQTYMTDLLLKITRHFEKKYNLKNQDIVNSIKKYICENYKSPISISDLAEKVALTPNYVSSIFRQDTGKTITEYITSTRLEEAKELLKNPLLTIVEISELIGFENASYFSTVFKKYIGVTPQKYRGSAVVGGSARQGPI